MSSTGKTRVQVRHADTEPILVNEALEFDLRKYMPAEISPLGRFGGTCPVRGTIAVNSKYLTLNGRPWMPSWGEFHYSRYPQSHWEDGILKMKASGITAVAGYTFWNHHEEVEGEFCWTGNRSLRNFVELCAKHGMLFFARIGPWSHGEVRYGGHPDWLIKKNSSETLRSIYPEYMGPTEKLYEEIGRELKGLYWKDGGPVFAVQLDNENWEHGEGKGEVMMRKLKELALKYGINAPLYTCTGWGNAEFPQDEILPVFGSYADYFWSTADKYYRGPSYSFSYKRPVGDIGSDIQMVEGHDDRYTLNPYMTCETGIGMNMAYHRRTNIDSTDNGALSLVELGNGCNGMGYYIFQGGANPAGKLSRMNESIETGFNDNSVFSNDFQAAIGENGVVRDWYHEYPVQFGLLNDFGENLAPMEPVIPAELIADQQNPRLLQRSLRTDGQSGFLFVNNHAANGPVHDFRNVQFDIRTRGSSVRLPESPVDIPAHSYFIWPINMQTDGAVLKYASAQPFGRSKEQNTYLFFQNKELPVEFLFSAEGIQKITGSCIESREVADGLMVKVTAPGFDCFLDIEMKDGSSSRIIVLTEWQAKHSYRQEDRLYISDAEILLFDGGRIELISENTENKVWVLDLSGSRPSGGETEGLFSRYEIVFDKVKTGLDWQVRQEYEKTSIPPRRNGDNPRLGVPHDRGFDKGTVVDLDLSPVPDCYDIRIAVDYRGSAGRFFVDGEFVMDNYYNGEKWILSLDRILGGKPAGERLCLKFVPLQKDDDIYIAGEYWPEVSQEEYVLEVNEIKAVPVYKGEINLP